MEPLNEGYLVSIGTTHPWNIAGVGLDARVALEYGIAHAAAIAGVSAQDRTGVRALYAIPPEVLQEQLRALPGPVAAFRIGALVSTENVRTVGAFLRGRAGEVPVVLDPVIKATLGGTLQRDAAMTATLLTEIVAAGAIVTPNVDEAATLTGIPVADESSMIAAGRSLVEKGALGALVTGGHLEGDPVDVLVTIRASQRFSGPRLQGSMRGSGCTLAASLACELVRGADLYAAAARAHAYVREKIAAGTMRAGLQVAF